MKTISDYSIYCTLEQTEKASDLGALLKSYTANGYVESGCAEIPTAEQMISWLEEQEDIFEIQISRVSTGSKTNNWNFAIFNNNDTDVIIGDIFFDRKEATIAAIDAALEYLKENKK